MIRMIEHFVALTESGKEVGVFKIRDQARESLAEKGSGSPSAGKERLELENGMEVTLMNENTFQVSATGERLTRKL